MLEAPRQKWSVCMVSFGGERGELLGTRARGRLPHPGPGSPHVEGPSNTLVLEQMSHWAENADLLTRLSHHLRKRK